MAKGKSKAAKAPEILCVQILEARPNPMFTEEQRSWVRFLCFNQATPCAACGKRKRTLWTMLCEFKAVDMDGSIMVAKDYPQAFAPLTGVCNDHPIRPNVERAKQ